MVQPALSLALSIFANKGAYALLLGSGLSSAAGIPTGWEISRDYARRASALVGDDTGDDPGTWFEARFGKPATYSNVLETFDPAQGGRSGLLRSYFEPTQQDREAGRKVPTAAHHAIAALVAKGYIRIVLTTNFDSLLEQALDAASVPYQVIASPDDADGARPFMLESCTIIKVNGDYRDTRSKNTDQELGDYDPRMERAITRVLDDFGLVVCGWSTESDAALVKLVQEHQSPLFATYWTHRRVPKGIAASLITARHAQLLKIEDADSFFRELEGHVTALERTVGKRTLDAASVFESVKRYVPEDRHRVQLEDLMIRLTRDLIAALPDHDYPSGIRPVAPNETKERLAVYEVAAERVLAAMVAGCYWGEEQHWRLWSNTVTQLATLPGEEHGSRSRPDKRLYPALLAMYSGGIAAVAAGRYDNLSAVLLKSQARLILAGNFTTGPAMLDVHLANVLHVQEEAALRSIDLRLRPLSYHLRDVLLPSFASLFIREEDYDRWFNLFEYLTMLVFARLHRERTGRGRLYAPRGKLVLRGFYGKHELSALVNLLLQEARAEGNAWGAVQAGLFPSVAEFEQLVVETEPWGDEL